MTTRVVGSSPAAPAGGESSATSENHNDSGAANSAPPEQSFSACAKYVPIGTAHAVADPSVTHGKNGVPPLPVVEETRRCVGVPPSCDCEAVLGPEVQGDLCAHCAAHLEAIRAEEDDVTEVFIDCDGCYPARRPLSGKLCSRCRQRRITVLAAEEGRLTQQTHAATLGLMIRGGFITAEDAAAVEGAMARVAVSVDASAAGLSRHAGAVYLALLRDFVHSLVRVHKIGGAL